MNYKLLGSSASAAVLSIALVVLTVKFSTEPAQAAFSLLILVAGYAIGWLLGIVVSPYSKEEKDSFTEYAKALGAFASGWLVGKIDKVVEAIFQPDFLLKEPLNSFRIIAFGSALIIALVITFVFRMYASVKQ